MTLPGPDEWPVEDPLDDHVGDLLAERATATPDALALIDADTGQRWRYSDLDERVAGRVERLTERFGAEDGRVGLLLETRPAVAELYFAVGRRGSVAVPLNVELPTDRLRAHIEAAGLDCLVCSAATEALATAAAPADVPVASVDEPTTERVDSLGHRADGVTAASRETAVDADRLILFTSGTTGDPKGVRLTTTNLVASAVGSAKRLGVEPDDRWLVCLPTYHMGGLAPIVRSTLYGTTTVVQRSFDADATAAALAEYDVTGVSLVPTLLGRLLDAGWTPPDSLRFVLLGGAPAGQNLLERAADRGVPVYPTYGTTETASQIATATPAEAREHPGTVGRPLDGTDVRVVGDDGGTVPLDDHGELVVAGPTVSPGYLTAEQTDAAFDERGFHTGDLGYRDADGRLWVLGRLDDRIVTGGENVSATRVANVLGHHDAVAEAAVVGLPDEEWGERVAALVVPSATAVDGADSFDASTSIDSVGLRDHAREHLASYAVPKTVVAADAIPRTASGTVDRDAVWEILARRE